MNTWLIESIEGDCVEKKKILVLILLETNSMNEEIIEKLRYMLLEISKQKLDEKYLIEILNESSFNFEDASDYTIYNRREWEYNLKIYLSPDIFIKNFDIIKNTENIIKHRLNTVTPPTIIIRSVAIVADIDKLVLIKSKIFLLPLSGMKLMIGKIRLYKIYKE